MRVRTEEVEKVCDSKVLYDTKFEAELAAARKSWDAVVYMCPGTKHFHIAHRDRTERMGYGYKLMKCPKCKEWIKRKGASKHIKKCHGKPEDNILTSRLSEEPSEGDTEHTMEPTEDR